MGPDTRDLGSLHPARLTGRTTARVYLHCERKLNQRVHIKSRRLLYPQLAIRQIFKLQWVLRGCLSPISVYHNLHGQRRLLMETVNSVGLLRMRIVEIEGTTAEITITHILHQILLNQTLTGYH